MVGESNKKINKKTKVGYIYIYKERNIIDLQGKIKGCKLMNRSTTVKEFNVFTIYHCLHIWKQGTHVIYLLHNFFSFTSTFVILENH